MALHSVPERRERAKRARPELLAALRQRCSATMGGVELEAVIARLQHNLYDIVEPLDVLYGERTDVIALVRRLLEVVADGLAERPERLRVLDRRREVDPVWFQRSRMIGYVAYTDRFAGDLAGVRKRLDYLAELGVTYLHLMPLLQARDGDNDGGYAVVDYRSVQRRLGTMADLQALADDLHERGMSLCIDLVLNHTAAEHPWARAAAAGDPALRDYYLVFDDRTEPDEYERTLPYIFPQTAPGNFTNVSGLGWVWTTFNAFQWDLNWANPDVFAAMLDTMLYLVNRGVDVLRLDAVPFMWKRRGTDCQNQPEAHLLLQALRGLVRVAAPGVLFKAEAIVAPEQLVQYLGAHERHRPQADLAYHNQLMVMLWSALAARDVRLASTALARMRPAPPGAGWVTYVRCHDDIGWAVSDADAAAVGWNGHSHRRFLADFYSGAHPGSFARGVKFQADERTADARTSGMTAALCGISAARQASDVAALEAGARRLLLLYSIIYSFGGIPLVYMGDELALGNDDDWAARVGSAQDNRWLHRPPMDRAAADRRSTPGTLEHRVFTELRRMGAARRSLLALRTGAPTWLKDTGNAHVLGYVRRHPRSGTFLALANFSDHSQHVSQELIARLGTHHLVPVAETAAEVGEQGVALPPWGYLWLTEP